jgi:hypothetical protein
VQLIGYRGWPLALAAPDPVRLHLALGLLSEDDVSDSIVRFACVLAQALQSTGA